MSARRAVRAIFVSVLVIGLAACMPSRRDIREAYLRGAAFPKRLPEFAAWFGRGQQYLSFLRVM